MALHASHFTLLDLFLDGLYRPSFMDHVADVVSFLAAYMIELKMDRVAFPTVNARTTNFLNETAALPLYYTGLIFSIRTSTPSRHRTSHTCQRAAKENHWQCSHRCQNRTEDNVS